MYETVESPEEGILSQVEFAVTKSVLQCQYRHGRPGRGRDDVSEDDVTQEGPHGEVGGGETRNSKGRDIRRPNTRRKGTGVRGKRWLWRREIVLCPTEVARQRRSSVGRESEGWGKEEES